MSRGGEVSGTGAKPTLTKPSGSTRATPTCSASTPNPISPFGAFPTAFETQVYQAILERRPAPAISRLKEILTKPDPALGFYNGELRFWLGWAQEVAGEHAAAQESWKQARNELEPFLKEQPDNYALIGDIALISMALGDKAAALALAQRAVAVSPLEKDALNGSGALE